MPLPPKAIQDEFAAVVNPIRDQISIASRTAERVAATRDLLLHRLVTGRLDISGLDLGDL
jgi:type I restriction enzyme S subunit